MSHRLGTTLDVSVALLGLPRTLSLYPCRGLGLPALAPVRSSALLDVAGAGEADGPCRLEDLELEDAEADRDPTTFPVEGALLLRLSLCVRSFNVCDRRGDLCEVLRLSSPWPLLLLLLDSLGALLGLPHKPLAAVAALLSSADDRLLPRFFRRDLMADVDRNGDIDRGSEAKTSWSDSLESSSSAQICRGSPVSGGGG